MACVTIELPHHRYDVVIEPGLLEAAGERVRAVAPHERCALLTDDTVRALYGDPVAASLEAAGYRVTRGSVPAGEAGKNLASIERLYGVLLADRLERRSPVIALGGGVVGDMAGFVAATYLRGVPFVNCPTTLLAMVDSSVGGKTGFNVPQGKNLIGAFHQPALVLIDPRVLSTLPERELRCGLAECIKHAVIRDPDLFEWIAAEAAAIRALDPGALVELIRRNVEIKARVVMEDERESGVRAHLNFGHTFAHAIEATAGYGEVLHGEAVALGMIAATRTSVSMGLCDASLLDRLVAVIEAFGLATRCPLASDSALDVAMRHDKKVIGGSVRLVLPDRLGHVVVRDDVPPQCVRDGWDQIRASGSPGRSRPS
jgi:3-dehydroquinate synthase